VNFVEAFAIAQVVTATRQSVRIFQATSTMPAAAAAKLVTMTTP